MESVSSTVMLGDWLAEPPEVRSHKGVPFLLLWAGQGHSWPIAALLWPHAVYSQICKPKFSLQSPPRAWGRGKRL